MVHQDLIPKFGSHNRSQMRKKKLTNTDIREVLIKCNMATQKRVGDDFGVSQSMISNIMNNYVLVRGHLYRRVEDGNK